MQSLVKEFLMILLSAACIMQADAMAMSVGQSHIDYAESAYKYLEKHSQEYGLVSPRSELEIISEDIDSLGYAHIKFQQMVRDVPVWSSVLSVHFNDKNEIYRVSGKAFMGLKDVSTIPALSPEDAANMAIASYTDQEGRWSSTAITMYVFAGSSEPKLVYEVTLKKGLKRMFVFVDAHDGTVVKLLSGTPTRQ